MDLNFIKLTTFKEVPMVYCNTGTLTDDVITAVKVLYIIIKEI